MDLRRYEIVGLYRFRKMEESEKKEDKLTASTIDQFISTTIHTTLRYIL